MGNPDSPPVIRHRYRSRGRRGWALRAAISAAVVGAIAGALVVVANPAGAAPAAIRLTSSSCPANIVQGQNSGCVTELQNLLNQHGAGLVVDGDFGANTLHAVRNFQSAVATAAVGQVGPVTKSKLYSSNGSAPAAINLNSSSCPSNVVQGQKSGCVTEL